MSSFKFDPLFSLSWNGHRWMNESSLYNPKNDEQNFLSRTVGKYFLRPIARAITSLFISIIGGTAGFLYHAGATLGGLGKKAFCKDPPVGDEAMILRNHFIKRHFISSIRDLVTMVISPILAIGHGLFPPKRETRILNPDDILEVID